MKCKRWCSAANKKRWLTDAAYREQQKTRLREWRDVNRDRHNALAREQYRKIRERDLDGCRSRQRRAYRVKMYGFDPGDNPLSQYKDRFRHARTLGYRSGLEVSVCRGFDAEGVQYEYEPFRIPFIPKKTRFYKPDILLPNGILIELKGQFPTTDRTKHLAVKADNPDLDIRFVFSNPNNRLNKQSKTTYAMWCETHAFKFCAASSFTRSWLAEPPNVASLAAIAKLKESKKK